MLNLLVLASALISTTCAHLMLSQPVPFGLDTLNNSPLNNVAPGAAGSDFPCKLRTGVYDITSMNNMKVGEPQLLNFTGSASHGGGTCHLSITTDLEPTAKSTFRLIQVFEGACPKYSDGNEYTNPFTFQLPEGTPNGRLTLVWTWYNRIGAREIYQNCAPLSVTGGADNIDYYDSLPNAWFANLPNTDCATADGMDAIVPFPGQFLLQNDGPSLYASAIGPGCAALAAAQTAGVKGYKSATIKNLAATGAPASNGDVQAAPSSGASASASASSTIAGGYSASAPMMTSISAPVISIIPIATLSTATMAPLAYPTNTAAAPIAPIVSPLHSNSTSSSSSNTTSTACPTDGALVCNGPTLFGLCNFGSVVWQPVAAGTTCTNGAIVKKRHLRAGKRHGGSVF